MNEIIRRIRGDIAPAELGPCDAHEHLFLVTPAQPGDEFSDVAKAVEEAETLVAAGGRALVDWTPIGLGRDLDGLLAAAEATGLHVVAATGLHRDAHYESEDPLRAASEEELADRFVADLERCGIIKLGAGYHAISPFEAKAFSAGGLAHSRTGAPVCVHTEQGTMGLAIVERLHGLGVAPTSVVLAHVDRNPDPGEHAETAAAGAWLQFEAASTPDVTSLRTKPYQTSLFGTFQLFVLHPRKVERMRRVFTNGIAPRRAWHPLGPGQDGRLDRRDALRSQSRARLVHALTRHGHELASTDARREAARSPAHSPPPRLSSESAAAVEHVLWIGGPPSSGKTTIATRLAQRHGLRLYSADTRTWVHRDRAIRAGNPAAIRWEEMPPRERREQSTPAEMLAMSLHRERGPMIVDDGRRLPTSPLIVAEGTPVSPVGVVDRDRAVWLLPTPELQRARLDERGLEAGPTGLYLLLAAEIDREAREHGMPVLTLDRAHGIHDVVAAVEALFADALADGPRAETAAERRQLLREANEAIVEQVRAYYARSWADGDPDKVERTFVCECGDPSCDLSVDVRVGDAAAGRVLAAGHT